jgi:tetratricopeptide (TPR) repeat protein
LCSGRAAEAVEELLQSILEDPLYPIIRVNYSMSLNAAGRLPEAIEEMIKLQELTPVFWPVHGVLSNLYWLQGNFAQALSESETAYQSAPWSLRACAGFAGHLAATGQPERAAEMIAKLNPDTYGAPMALAMYHAIRGEFDVAAEYYAKGIEQRDPGAPPGRYMLGPAFRSSAHWPRLAKMMNLPQTMSSRSF